MGEASGKSSAFTIYKITIDRLHAQIVGHILTPMVIGSKCKNVKKCKNEGNLTRVNFP